MFSYRQTIAAYPNGGGSYIVSKDNLGTGAGLVAGASLLVDYTLTVAVSIAAGTAAITSAIEPLRGHAVATAVVLLVLLDGRQPPRRQRVRAACSPRRPTATSLIMSIFIGYGLARTVFGDLGPLPVDTEALDEVDRRTARCSARRRCSC